MPTQSDSKSVQSDFSKSSYTELELLAMAGNVKAITHVTGNIYNVELYGNSTVYTTTISDFYIDSLVVLKIDNGTTLSTSTFDIKNNKLDIQNDALYYFNLLDNDSMHSGSSTLFTVTIALTSHHLETPRMSTTFINNGSSDVFPDDVSARNCFWCKEIEENHDIGGGLCTTIVYPTYFWIDFDSYQCGDAYPCGHAPTEPDC